MAKDPQTKRPPAVAEKLLGWLVRDPWGTPQGDFEEWFHALAEERGLRHARWWYWKQVLRMTPERVYEKTYWGLSMLKSYFIVAARNLRKNKAASAINLVGLSIAVACSIVAYRYIQHNLVLDDFHADADRLFLVEQEGTEGERAYTFGTTPLALAPALEADFPQVERAVRVVPQYLRVTHGDLSLDDEVRFVDADFFEVFTFPLRYGTPDALADPATVVVSADFAERYFGDANPVGQTLRIEWARGDGGDFTVGGVAEPFPGNTGFQFSVAASYAWLRAHRPDAAETWANHGATFVRLRETAVREAGGLEALAAEMGRYVPRQPADTDGVAYGAYRLDNLTALSHHADDVQNMPVGGVPWPPIIVLGLIAVFLLTLACLNFVNVALATMARRFKEIGMRKVMGGTRRQLITQLLAENLLLALSSLVVGTVLAGVFLIPAFNGLSGDQISLGLLEGLGLWGFLAVLLVLVALVSGAYPALYVSALQPADIFRGTPPRSRRRVFMHGFLTLQFVLAFITMIASVTFVMNGRYDATRDWGYGQTHVLGVEVADPARYALLRAVAQEQPGVASLSGSRDHLGRSATYTSVEIDARPVETVVFAVEPTYAATMGLRLRSGRFFDADGSGRPQGVVINEAFARERGWDDPLGQTLRLDGAVQPVIGVVEDYYYEDFTHAVSPALLVYGDPAEYRYLTLRVAPGAGTRTAAALEAAWNRIAPGEPFQPFFQDEVFDSYYREMHGLTRLFGFVAAMALLISCMGLFGLVAQHVASRMREVGMRKVLGASVAHLLALTNRRFALLLLIAALLATPASYVLVSALQASVYADTPPALTAAPFVLAYALVFLTAALTVSTQVRKLVTVNPATVLRDA